jgi:hypothetical protein
MNTNINTKIIYSLRVHVLLQQQGFQYLVEMRNPFKPQLNCWVYEETPDLLTALDAILGEENGND